MNMRFVIVFLAICFLGVNVVLAQDRVTDLESKLRAQEQKIQELEQKLSQIQSKGGDYTKQLVQEYLQSPEAQEQMGVVAGYDNGFFLRTKDVEFKFTGWLQVGMALFENDTNDGVDWSGRGVWGTSDDGAVGASNTFGARAARIQFHMYFFKYWHAVVDMEAGDLAGNDLLRDAYIEYQCSDPLNVRVGQFIVPFSIEAQELEWDMLTIGSAPIVQTAAAFGPRGVGTPLYSKRDVGLMAYGFLFDYVGYAVAITNGTGRNAVDNNDDFHYFIQGRFYPFTTEHKRTFVHAAFMRGREGQRTNGATLGTPWGWDVFDASAQGVPANEPTENQVVAGALDTTSGQRTGVSFGYSFIREDIPFRTEAEFIWMEFSRDRGVAGPWDQGSPVWGERRASRIQMYGFWIQFSYFIQITDDKDTGIEPLLKIDYADVDDESADYPGALGDVGIGHALAIRGQDLWDFTLGVRGHLNKHIRLDFNWVISKPENSDHIGPNIGSAVGSISDKIDHSGGLMHAFLFQIQAKW